MRPNELTLEKPYITRHIEATRAAYGSTIARGRGIPGAEGRHASISRANKTLLDNVRLWDWRAFHDTLSQSQPLRPYTYADTDVDRYQIDGQLRQTLLAPRELDLNQLGDARNSWINRSLTFTHGYGLVLAEANRITPTGLPELLVKDAPVMVDSPSLKLTRPEIYYGETVRTSRYSCARRSRSSITLGVERSQHALRRQGRIPHVVAGRCARWRRYREGDWNILLTNALTPESRMMIHRKRAGRLATLAEFISWDDDPTW